MGWNDLVIDQPHPVLAGWRRVITRFVHSRCVQCEDAHLLAHVDYAERCLTAIVIRDNIVGTQLEKSQMPVCATVANFLNWKPDQGPLPWISLRSWTTSMQPWPAPDGAVW
jgi:glutamine amidotransferase